MSTMTMSTKATATKSSIKTTLMTVTPAKAAEWLEQNHSNRKLRMSRVREIARDIQEGRWKVTHQGIAFNCDGSLRDGQHRLHAIVMAGIPVKCQVTTGLQNDTLDYVDRNATRTDADIMRLNGMDVTSKEVAVARSICQGFHHTSGGPKVTMEQLRSVMERYGEGIRFACSTVENNTSPAATAQIVSVVAKAYYSADHERLRKFMSCLFSRFVENPEDRAAGVLLVHLDTKYRRATPGDRKALHRRTAYCLAHFLAGTEPRRAFEAAEDPFPLPDDQDASQAA